MAYRNNIIRKYYTSVANFVADLWSELSAMGWTLEDNQDGSSYRVYSSTNPNGVKGWLRISWTTAQIKFWTYTYWNSGTHTGYGKAASETTMTFSESGTYMWIYGNDQFILLFGLISSTYYLLFGGHLIPDVNIPLTYLTASATAGSNVQIAVNSTSNFKAGKKVQIVDDTANGYRQWVTIASIDDATHMTISSLANNYPSGARIGATPILFGSAYNDLGSFYYTCPLCVSGNGTPGATNTDYYLVNYQLFNNVFLSPNYRQKLQQYGLQPMVWGSSGYSSYYALGGYRDDYIFHIPLNATKEDIFLYTDDEDYRDMGTSTGTNDSTTLNDTTKSWTTNAFQNKVVVITGGTGAGQIRKISSNSSTQLVVSVAWTTIPDDTSQYKIVDEAYRCVRDYIAVREGV